MSAPAVLLQGIDVGDTSYWSWEWRHGIAAGGIHAIRLDRLRAALDELEDALPGIRPAELALDVHALRARMQDVHQTRAQRENEVGRALKLNTDSTASRDAAVARVLRRYAALDRCLTGALSAPVAEAELMGVLAGAILHEDFLEAVISVAASTDSGIDIAILPAQSCVRVPFEMLRVRPSDDTRLLDLARVTTLAPQLARESREGRKQRPSRRARSPLRVIDPRTALGSVTAPNTADTWARRPGRTSFRGEVDRAWLSEMLPGASHLTYLGHVETGRDTTGRPDPATTGLVLSESGGAGSKSLLFTAQDAIRGTAGFEGAGLKPVPETARSVDGTVVPRSGRELWPMPPRVAIIACESGADYRDVEPFGLVTAFLELGAEAVTATRWVMYTDRAIGTYETGSAPLEEAALQIDELQDSAEHPDAAAALTDWKRQRLQRWREFGTLAASPVTWAAFTLYRSGAGASSPGTA